MKEINTNVENPNWKKPQMMMSKEFTIVMEEYKIHLRVMYTFFIAKGTPI